MKLREALANLDLWIKLRISDPLTLSDVPNVIPAFWNYFKDNWRDIKISLEGKINSFSDPDLLQQHISNFDNYIESRRYGNISENPFNNSAILSQFYTIFEVTNLSELPIKQEESLMIQETISTVSDYNRADFLTVRKAIENARNIIADRGGAYDADFDRIYNRVPEPQNHDITLTDMIDAYQLQSSIDIVNQIIVTLGKAREFTTDLFALTRLNAKNENFIVGNYTSGYLVKMNYGDTLQSVAYKYLGDPDVWMDIAIANGLQPPYIDETGEKVYIISASENNIIIPNKDENGNKYIEKIYTNQPIFLVSNDYPYPEQRVIVNIENYSLTDTLTITVDGNADLDRYVKLKQAYIRFYKPKTINSNFMVLIPTNSPTDTPLKELPWFLKNKAGDEKQTGVDIYIDDTTKDIQITSFGDVQLSYGLVNAFQALYLKLNVELGTLRRHPEFGIVNVLGEKNTNVDLARNSIIGSLTDSINSDSRFSGINNLSVEYKTEDANYFLINLNVRLSGGSAVIPISFRVSL